MKAVPSSGGIDNWATASVTVCSGEVRQAFLDALEQAGGVSALARKWRFSRGFISDLKLGRRGYGSRVLKRLGFKIIRHPPTYSYERLL